MRTAVKPKKFKRLRSMLGLSEKKRAKTYFLRDEMEVIVYSILGKRVECTDTGTYFYKHLSNLGFKKQVTIDSHPTLENMNFLLKKVDEKRKEAEGTVISGRTKRTRKSSSRESVNNVLKTVSVPKASVSVQADPVTRAIVEKISSQSLDTLSFENGKVVFSFK